MAEKKQIDRRRFLSASATTAAFTMVPRHVLGGSSFRPPSDKINIGYVGAGTQGLRQLMQALPRDELRIVALCDPNTESNDYIPWSRHEIRDKIRRFLKHPSWGEGETGCRCGRKVGLEVVNAYYGQSESSGTSSSCAGYSDFREMLETEKDLDAVYVMTPDHLHATVAIAAMKKGLNVIGHKPISNIYHETRLAVETARKTGVATHMFCSADQQSTPLLREWISNGAIGPVREVHNWSSRPFWPQGMRQFPDGVPVPQGMDWKLWLGPVPDMPYNPALTHAVFRGWYDFGAGSLGDMGHYSLYQIFKILKLGFPLTVEASRSQYWAIVDYLWKKQEQHIAYPRSSMIRWEFAAREDMPPVALHWYDGGMRPPLLRELEEDGKPMPAEGLLFVGDEGKILAGFSGSDPKLIPSGKMTAFKQPPQSLPRPKDELSQWIDACQGGPPSGASYDQILPFCETICLGNVALRVDKKLQWDADAKQFRNSTDANQLLKRKYRPGWEL